MADAIDDAQLVAILEDERDRAVGSDDDANTVEKRRLSLEYYAGRMDDLKPLPDRSSVQSSDVHDVVEMITPMIMDIIAAGDQVVEIMPDGEYDRQSADLETKALNRIFFYELDGFRVLQELVKDGLLTPQFVAKATWEVDEIEDVREFEGMDRDDIIGLLATGEWEITNLSEPDEEGRRDVTVERAEYHEGVVIDAVAPGQFGVSPSATTIRSAEFSFDWCEKTRMELKREGFDPEIVDDLTTEGELETVEEQERKDGIIDDEATHPDFQEITVYDHTVMLDMDGDDEPALWNVITAGAERGEVLKKERVSFSPYAGGSAIVVPHRIIGKSVAELVVDIQKIKTVIWRAVMDHAQSLSVQDIEVASDAAGEHTIQDLMGRNPRRIIRTTQQGAVRPIGYPTPAFDLPGVLNVADEFKEARVGVTKAMSGQDPDTLHKTFNGLTRLLSQQEMRVRLIARNYADGVRDLMLLIHDMYRTHATKPIEMEVDGQFTRIDPRRWRRRRKMRVRTGVGTGNRDMRIAVLERILNLQFQTVELQGDADGPYMRPENIRNTIERLLQESGEDNADPFFPRAEDIRAALSQQSQEAEVDPEIALKTQKMQAEEQRKEREHAAEIQLKKYEIDVDDRRQRAVADGELNLKAEQIALEHEAGENARDVQIGGDPG